MKYNQGEHRDGTRKLAQGRQRLSRPRLNEHLLALFADFYEGLSEDEAFVMDTILLQRVIKPALDPNATLDSSMPPMTLKQLSQVFQISQAGAKKIIDKGIAKANKKARQMGLAKGAFDPKTMKTLVKGGTGDWNTDAKPLTDPTPEMPMRETEKLNESNDDWDDKALEANGAMEIFDKIGDTAYEIRHQRRGASTKCKTYSELSEYVSELADTLNQVAETVIWDLGAEYGEDD